MKTHLLIAGVVVIVIAGWLFMSKQTADAPSSTDNQAAEAPEPPEGDRGQEFIDTILDSGGENVEMAFDHVAPGQYSEVYVTFVDQPNSEVRVDLRGPSIEPPTSVTVTTDENGQANVTFRIYAFGKYEADVFYGDNFSFLAVSDIVVQ